MSLKDELLKAYDKDGNPVAERKPLGKPETPAKTPTEPTDPVENPTVTEVGDAGESGDSKANTSGVGAMNDMAGVYENMISQNNAMAAKEQAAIDQYAEEQKKLQQEATDLTLQQMEQQKAEAADDYAREQSAAYVDYQRQTAKHGVQAEQMASMGMTGTGYSESAKVAMYNAYQQRVAVARQTYTKLVTDYNNAMAEAKLQNSSALAQIAFNALQSGLQLNQQTLQNAQNLLIQKLNAEDQRNAQRAEILAATGDYSGYQALYGLTKEQAEALAASNGSKEYESIDSDELAKWETRFKTAGSVEAMKKIVEMMLANKISPDIAYGLYEMYKSSKEGTGNGVLGNIGNAVSGWFGNLFGKKDTNTEETGLEIKP